MIEGKIIAAYEQMAESYNRLVDHKPHNAYYDRPNTLSLINAPQGKTILDAACGPGKYAEILLAQGAAVTGFDVSPKMIGQAKQRNKGAGHFFVHNLSEPFTTLANEQFDIVLCALAMHYVQDWNPVIQEFNRVLKPHGQLVISIEHPFFEYTFFRSEKYFETEPVKCVWQGFDQPVEVNSYRRPLQACIMPIIENGFYLDKILEPKPTEEFAQHDPKHYAELNAFPAFMCLRAVKRG